MNASTCVGIFLSATIIPAFALAVITGVVGYCILTPGKLVRIMFPYIKRKGNDTVMFEYILSETKIISLFYIAVNIMFYCTLIFFSNIFIAYRGNNNPYEAYSTELYCFYDNDTLVELNHWERMELQEPMQCYAINFNISGAMGQVTGALALAWIIAAIITILPTTICKIYKNIKEYIRGKSCLTDCKNIIWKDVIKTLPWSLLIFCLLITIMNSICMCYDYKSKLPPYILPLENIFIVITVPLLQFGFSVCNCPKKASISQEQEEQHRQTLEKIILKHLEKPSKRQLKSKVKIILNQIIPEIIEFEYKRMLANEVKITDDKIKKLVKSVSDKVLKERQLKKSMSTIM